MNGSRGIPPGRGGLIILAAACVPIVIKKFKPIVRFVGKKLTEVGDKVQRIAEEVDAYDKKKAEEAAKKVAEPKPADIPETKTASPTGQEEVKAQKASAQTKTAKPPKPAAKKAAAPKTGKEPPKAAPKRVRKAAPPNIETA